MLDVSAMDRAAVALVGRHDFSAFGGKHRQPIRTLYGVRVRRKGRMVTVDVAVGGQVQAGDRLVAIE